MFKKLFSRSALAVAAVAGALSFSPPAANADTNIRIWLGFPGLTYWNGPGYYRGIYRHRLTCNEGRHVVDIRGFNRVRATDCTPRYYHYRAWRNGHRYTVRLDSRTGRMTFWRS